MEKIFFQLVSVIVMALLLHGHGHASQSSQIKAMVKWRDAASKPSEVEFQNSGAGNEDFEPKVDNYYGEKTFPQIRAKQKIIVRWTGGKNVVFNVNARVGADVFSFTVEKPQSQLTCSNGDVNLLVSQRSASDMDTRIALMQSARMLLNKKTNPCSTWNRGRLVKLNFDLSCNLAKETTFFDLSTEAATRFSDEFPNSTNVVRQISSCRNEVIGLVLKAAYNASQTAKKNKDAELFSSLNGALLDAMNKSEFKGGFAKIGVDRLNLTHSKVEVLFAQYENRTNDPQIAVDAAQQINDLSNSALGRRAILKSGLSLRTARQLLPTAQRVLAASAP